MRSRRAAVALAVALAICLLGAWPAAPAPVRAQVAAPASTTLKITVGDSEVAYRVLGQGRPLMLIMGFRGTMDTWDATLLSELAAHYLVILFDNRGTGDTVSPAAPFTIAGLADDTAALLDALGIETASVLGYSMGGYIAQELALRHPARVERLILHATSCGGAEAIAPDAQSIATLSDTTTPASELGPRILTTLLPAPWVDSHRAYLLAFGARQQSGVPHETVARQLAAMNDWPGACPRLRDIANPALIIAGTADAVIPPANALVLANSLPAPWLALFADGGHGMQYQYPKPLAATIHNFLSAP